jgi:hypothetical protein
MSDTIQYFFLYYKHLGKSAESLSDTGQNQFIAWVESISDTLNTHDTRYQIHFPSNRSFL